MGAISFSLDPDLLDELLRLMPFQLFIETGTFRGESLEIARTRFPHCISIELAEEYYESARAKFAAYPHVELIRGDSAPVIEALRPRFTGTPTFFWLDAHWCAADNTAGERSQCPLVAELRAIGRLARDSVIVIDDARLFLTPPPAPHEISDWPDLDDVLRALNGLSAQHALACFNDVLLFLPRDMLCSIRPFFHQHASNLLSIAERARQYDQMFAQAQEKEAMIASLKDETETRARGLHEKDEALILLTRDLEAKEAVIWDLQTRVDALHEKDEALILLTHEFEAKEAVIRDLQARAGTLREKDELNHDLEAKEVVIRDLKRICEERAQLINRLALKSDRPIANTRTVVSYRVHGFFGRMRRALRLRFNAWLEQRVPGNLGKLVQYAPQPILAEKFPAVRAPRQWPRICLVTPSYNQAHFLPRTMQSVLAQNYPHLAYGVQDGGSSDASAQLIHDQIGRLAHAESTKDEGQADAIQKGFKKLYPENQDIMGWLNSDDLLMPGSLAYVGAYFARHPEVDVIYGHRVIIDERDQEIGRWYLPRYHEHTLKYFDLVPQETLFWRARCYNQIGGLDPNFHFAMDWDLLLRFEEAGFNIRRVPYFLGCFRVHSEQKTSRHIETVGEQEMQRLRRRTHQREVAHWEIHRHLADEVGRSTLVAWLHKLGLRH